MDQVSSAKAIDARQPGYRVEAPRASDALGLALRDAYVRETGLPEDMVAMLRQLNRDGR
jgi:hypothetical protein